MNEIREYMPLVRRIAERMIWRVRDRAIEAQDLASVGYAAIPAALEAARAQGLDPRAAVAKKAHWVMRDAIPRRPRAGRLVPPEVVGGAEAIAAEMEAPNTDPGPGIDARTLLRDPRFAQAAEVLAGHAVGFTFEEIGEGLGLTAQGAHYRVTLARARLAA